VVAILPCASLRHQHTCEETQGVWMTRITGEPTFYCRHHAVEVIERLAIEGSLTAINLRHLDVDLLLQIAGELLCTGASAFDETSEYDRDRKFHKRIAKISAARRLVESVIDRKTAQLDITLI